MHFRKIASLAALALLSTSVRGAEPMISEFRQTYFTAGVPLNREINNKTIDLKFQLSVKLRPFIISEKWKAYLAYTQVSTWTAFCESAPFHDNQYKPGIYFENSRDGKNTILLGLEHCSNGRPYYGNPLSSPGHEDYSRGMNYFYAAWVSRHDHSTFLLSAKAGIGNGVESFEAQRYEIFSQELFYRYMGYVTFGYRYHQEKWDISASVTPIVNKSIANVTLESSWEFSKRSPRLFVQLHYGFDEALCDCVKDATPPMNIRVGLVFGR